MRSAGRTRRSSRTRDQLGLAIYGRDFRATDQSEPRALFEQALAARRTADDRRAVAESLFHVALTWENKKDPTDADKAREYFERAGAEADRIGAARFRKMADDAFAALQAH